MNFYTVNGSPNTRKVHAVINYLGLDINIIELDMLAGDLQTPEFFALNPNGMVPVLEDDNFKLWESNAIMQYLASTAPNNDLYPADLQRRADINRWQCWELQHYNRATSTFVWENIFKKMLEMGPADQDKLKQAAIDYRQYAAVLEQQLDGKKFILGDKPSLADFSVGSMSAYMEIAAVPYESFANITAWLDRLEHQPAWANTPRLAA